MLSPGLIILFLLISYNAFSTDLNKTGLFIYQSGTTVALTGSFMNFIITLLGTLFLVCMLILFFSIRLRRVNRELEDRNKQILDINNDLQRINGELEVQKAQITREYYESDKFYRMVVQ